MKVAEFDKPSYLLVITCTITPASGAQILRTDPDLRRRDYLEAFRFWLNINDSRLRKILFLENSNADLSDFYAEAKLHPNVEAEFISVPPEPLPTDFHYGFLEMKMIDHGLRFSKLWTNSTHLIKVTGRLRFPDLPSLLDRLPPVFDIAVDTCQRLLFGRRPAFVLTQLFLSSKPFYEAWLQTGYTELNDVYPLMMEQLFYDRLTKMPRSRKVILRFPVNAEPVGFAGYSGQLYERSERRLLITLRALSRRFTPWFWL